MVAAISFTSQGARQIERMLAGLHAAFDDLTPLMEGFGSTIEGFVLDRFETETAPDGTPWKPSIRARQDGRKTLTDSTQLRDSRTHIARSDSVEVGTNKIYAGVHQFGATIRAKSAEFLAFNLPGGLGFRKVKQVEIPKREFLGLSIDDEAELIAQAEDYARAAAGAGA